MIYLLLSCAISYFLGYNKPVEGITIIRGIPLRVLFGGVIPQLRTVTSQNPWYPVIRTFFKASHRVNILFFLHNRCNRSIK